MKKQFRVRKNQEFSKIIAGKHIFRGESFIIYASIRNEDHSRVGISVSKKLGNAVCRNKIKRQLRMMLQSLLDFKEDNYDYIVIVRPNYLNMSFDDNKKDLEKTIKKVKMKGYVKR